jgi:CheY-like chemotaxis protein
MSATVVLAEDSKTVRKMVEIALYRQPFTLEVATEGEAAIGLVRDKGAAVLLVDTHLAGGVDGYEVARRVKASQPAVKVFLLAGHHQTLDADLAARSGADGHLTKPFQTQDLLDVVYLATTGRPAPGAELFREQGAPIPLARKPEAPKPAAPAPVPLQKAPGVAPPPRPPAAPAGAASNPFSGVQNPFETNEPTRPFFKAPVLDEAPALAPTPPAPVAAPVAVPIAAAPLVAAVAQATSTALDTQTVKTALEGLGKEAIERLLWEIVPPLAEAILKEEIAKVVRERMAAG